MPSLSLGYWRSGYSDRRLVLSNATLKVYKRSEEATYTCTTIAELHKTSQDDED